MSRRCFKSEIQGRPGPEGHTGFWHHVAFRGIALQPHCGVIFPHPSRIPQHNTPLQRHDRRDKRVTVHPPPETFPQTNGTLRFGATTPPPFRKQDSLTMCTKGFRRSCFCHSGLGGDGGPACGLQKDEVARSAWWEGYWCCVGSPGTVLLCTTTRSRGLRSQDFRVVRGG